MTWVKIPAEHHPLFMAALPMDPRCSVIKMFGGIGAMINGNMYAALFARSVIVCVNNADHAAATALEGAGVAPLSGMAMLPESVMHESQALHSWLANALAYTATLPAKQRKKRKKRKNSDESST